MVHVWQHRLGYPVRLRGAFRIGFSYGYTLREAPPWPTTIWKRRAICWRTTSLRHLKRPDVMRQARDRDSLALRLEPAALRT